MDTKGKSEIRGKARNPSGQGICFKKDQDEWEEVRALWDQVLRLLCLTVLRILHIALSLILTGVSIPSSRWTGTGLGVYQECLTQEQKGEGLHLTRRRIRRRIEERRQDTTSEQRQEQHQLQERRGKSQQRISITLVCLRAQGMHSKASSLKKKIPSNGQTRTTSTPPALRKASSVTSDNTPSSSSEDGRQQHQPESQFAVTKLETPTPSTASTETPQTGPMDSVSPATSVNVLRAVIPTPASAGLIFDGRGATRWVDEVLAFFKDWGCTGKDRYERILRHIDISLREDVKSIPEYTRTPFDEDAFFAALKRKYRDYDDDYTKNTRPFLDALILSAQSGRLEPKDFIELFHRVSANLKERKLLDEVEQANLFLYALPDRIRSKIVKKHNVDQDDGRTLVYSEFYKTALGVCESDEVIKRYKESHNPVMLSSKATAVNDIMKALNAKKGVTLDVPEAASAPLDNSQPPRIPVRVPALDKMFPMRAEPLRKSQDPRDDLARQLEELRIAQANAIREVRQEVSQEIRAAFSQNGVGFRGERGPGYNQRVYSGPRYTQSTQSRQDLANNTVNTSAAYGNFDGREGYRGVPNCFACYNVDRDGNPEQYPHGHSNRCPQLQELIQNGVCHKNSYGRLCLGPWREGAEEIMLRRDAPWVRQIISRTRGTQYDPDITRRAGNIQVEKDQEQEAAQARTNANATGANAIPIRSIMRRPDTPRIPVQLCSVVDSCGRDIDAFLNEQVNACSVGIDSDSDSEEWKAIAAYASQPHAKAKPKAPSSAVQSKVTKPLNWNEARKNKAELQRKAEAEAKLARPKARRRSAYTLDETEEPDDMSIGDTIEVVPRPDLPEEANVVRSLEEFDRISPGTITGDKPQRQAKLTAHQPKKSKGYRDLITQLGSGHPAEAVRAKLLADLVQYRELFEVTDTARAALKSLNEGRPIEEETVVSIQSLGLDDLVTRGWIVSTPKLSVSIMGPTDVALESAMLDTGAEANIMTYELAKSLGCPILSTENLKLKTVSGQILQFAGMAKAEVEIEHGVGCVTVFFLVRESKGQTLPMVLLGQPFTRAMRMTFEHGDHGDMDAVFHDPRNRHTCTVSVVSPAKRHVRSDPYQHAYVEDNHPEEEN